MNKRMKLSEIADIRQGYQFREKITFSSIGHIKVIQMANIINCSNIDYINLPYSNNENIRNEHFLKNGDIIFCARGNNNYNIMVNCINEKIIAVSQFVIIRPNSSFINNEYLSWFLKQKESISYFNSNRLVSTVPLINKNTLDELQIIVPPLEKQRTVVEIYKLLQKEFEIIDNIKMKKEKIINKILNLTINDKE